MQFDVRNIDFEVFEEKLAKYYLSDFPDDERCPVDKLKLAYLQDKIDILALFKEEVLYGYAILLLNANKKNCMIWYFAVIDEYRNMGVGTEFLKILQNKLGCFENVLIEVERRNCGADSKENAIREKRFNFYINAGMKLSDLIVSTYGVEFEIFSFGEYNGNVESLFEVYKDIYYNIRSKEIIDKKILKI